MTNVMITGTSSGLGEALVEHYMAQGCKVYGISRKRPENAGTYCFESCDLSDFASLPVRLEKLLGNVKELDLLILNAGVLGAIDDISKISLDALKATMDINMWANKVILDYMIEKKIIVKQVIGISSGASVSGSRGWNGYSLSKAALNMLLKLYAREMENTHITAVAPGLIETPMLAHLLYDEHDTGRFTSVQRLRDSKEGGDVMTPKGAAEVIDKALPKLLAYESGEFVDLRYL